MQSMVKDYHNKWIKPVIIDYWVCVFFCITPSKKGFRKQFLFETIKCEYVLT